jgi:tetratricopeptide (TPR) repeat protein
VKCPNCQAENREGAEFCGDCGQSLRQEVVCPQCGNSNPAGKKFCDRCGQPLTEAPPSKKARPKKPSAVQPTSFAGGRYQVKKFLGEGGKKKVYLAHDTLLDRDVAFALIKTENLDDKGKKRITREARAMGRLGDHPHIVTVYDIGEHNGQPYMVLPLLPGGDVEGLIEKAPEHRLPLDRAMDIARAVCQGLVFAHSKGIVHRDLKPGNVWLSADGTAKIGDFGLAVAVDLSRLTQSGMMVGTVSYMPPEQAMGGQVSEKADLYSLGAMLYEMVTGRPPFIGDDSAAIIGQHINTPPVSPTWHRADLPPALETLILQLLEKDPSNRPASASNVLQALESIDAGKASKELSKETSTVAENPLYRRVFVGREPELKQLQSAFDGAVSGQGALTMVVGEPGIGKTAVCQQLATYVTLRGGKTLVGHCYEEGSLSLPYLAFVEAMRSYVLSREVKDLREELGTGAADVARIVSEVREKLKVKPRPKGNPEEERYRLMQAVTSFLSNAATVQPLLLILEDLHDSDKGTLDMLTHISHHLGGKRLLIVGTYRDVEVDRTHPLSAALAELRRISTYGRVLLRGLNADEVRRMLESITREEVPWSLAEAVHRQTEGNPLFVQEVVRYLVEEGLISQKEGRSVKDTPIEMNIPEGLRDVIGKRLSLISKECNQLLSMASVIGRDFRLEVLKKVSGLSEEGLFSALEEAKKAAVVEERTGVGAAVTYRFAHAFFRQTLYEETIAPRRIRLHQQVARALEELYASRLEEHAAELAEHFSYSSDAADLAKAVSYGEMAAKRATDVYAYGEAVRLLEQAIKVQEILEPEDKAKRCDLLLELCEALFDIPEAKRIYEEGAPVAFSLAENLDDSPRAVRACMAAIYGLYHEQGLGIITPEMKKWCERLERHAKPDTSERVVLDYFLGGINYIEGDSLSGQGHLAQALAVARRISNQEVFWLIASGFIHYSQAPHHYKETKRLAEEIWMGSHVKPHGIFSWGLLINIGAVFLISGQRQRAEEVFNELRTLSERSNNFRLWLQSKGMDANLAVMDGRLEKALELVDEIQVRGAEAGATGVAYIYASHPRVRSSVYLGANLDEIERGIPRGVPLYIPELCLVQAHLGKKEEVSKILEECVVKRPKIGTDEDETRFWYDALYLESAVLAGHHQATELLMNRLRDTGLYTTGDKFPTCISRHLGSATALLGSYDEARKHYQEAIKVCTEMPFRPELALSRLQLAELLLEHYPDEKKEALEHLDFAINDFREMKMQPSLERALRHKDILKA